MTQNRWFILGVLAITELLGMSLWFTASAVAPHFRELWNLSPGQTAWLTTAVQLGFVAGTALAALSNLADVIPSRLYLATAALLAAGANVLLVVAPGFEAAVALRFITGMLLAGVYPPAMKMVSTWFRTSRGLAIGTVVGALTMGKATPYLLSAFPSLDYRSIIVIASVAAACGGMLVAVAYRDGPHAFPRRPFSWSLVPLVLKHRETRLAIAGYLGHMWELYATWAALGSYFLFIFSDQGMTATAVASAASMMAFLAIASGAFGSVVAGYWADRWGRENVTIAAMAVSATCAATIGWLTDVPTTIVAVIALIWGFSIVADSAQFSALVTEVAPPHAVGTALTLQTSLGFALTAISIGLTVEIALRFGWGFAFSLLAVGPVLGIWAMVRLRRVRTLTGNAAFAG